MKQLNTSIFFNYPTQGSRWLIKFTSSDVLLNFNRTVPSQNTFEVKYIKEILKMVDQEIERETVTIDKWIQKDFEECPKLLSNTNPSLHRKYFNSYNQMLKSIIFQDIIAERKHLLAIILCEELNIEELDIQNQIMNETVPNLPSIHWYHYRVQELKELQPYYDKQDKIAENCFKTIEKIIDQLNNTT